MGSQSRERIIFTILGDVKFKPDNFAPLVVNDQIGVVFFDTIESVANAVVGKMCGTKFEKIDEYRWTSENIYGTVF
jgi:hypothetical protein